MGMTGGAGSASVTACLHVPIQSLAGQRALQRSGVPRRCEGGAKEQADDPVFPPKNNAHVSIDARLAQPVSLRNVMARREAADRELSSCKAG